MRVLLVNPPILPAGAVPPPLSIATLAAFILDICDEVRVFDADLLFFDPEQRSRTSLNENFDHVVEDFAPDLVLFTSMYNNSALTAALIARVHASNLLTVGGGPHFGAQPKEALANIPALDFVIAGEGETATRALIGALRDGTSLNDVPNLVRRLDGTIRQNPKGPLLDLTQIPNVWEKTRGIIDLQEYAATISPGAYRSIYVEAGRGCPFNCNFCAPAQFWDRIYRVKSPQQISSELQYLFTKFGYDAFILVHDLLTVDPKFIRALSAEVKALDLPIRWMANSRTDLANAREFDMMVDAGCWRLFYGIDSGASRVQTAMGKGLDPKESFEVVKSAIRAGIGAVCSFVIGHPDETEEELSESIKLGARLKVAGAENVQFHRLRLFPPAPIAVGSRLDALLEDATLDETTLRLEYPFRDIADDERERIAADPRFYAGYFSPRSAAGLPEEISQAELFFTQGVAFSPLTIFALATRSPHSIVALFRAHLARCGYIDRYVFDPTDIRIVRNWVALKDRLFEIIDHADLSDTDRNLIEGILAYEDARMRFVHRQEPTADAILWGYQRAVIPSEVRIDRVLEGMLDEPPKPADLMGSVSIILEASSSQLTIVLR
ncbi:radical SAM protein [Rhizobium ruizarguesonis]